MKGLNYIVDLLALCLVRSIFFLLSILPGSVSIALLSGIIRLVICLMPKYRHVARRNLALVFPTLSQAERDKIMWKSCDSLARILYDFARLPKLDVAWALKNVEGFAQYQKLAQEVAESKKPVLLLSGHIGSFELLAHLIGLSGIQLNFVVRDFKLPMLNAWWNGRRCHAGNKVISRKGAFRTLLATLKKRESIGVLFDQNVTRQHATFVDFFGHLAATTAVVGLIAVEGDIATITTGLSYIGAGRYRFEYTRKDFSEIIANEAMSRDEKVNKVTQVLVRDLEKLILQSPTEWFWFHRRWKTAPEGVAEDFYR